MAQTAAATPAPHGAARRRLCAVRWLLAFYVLALGAPVFEALVARAAPAGATVVELCTGDDVRHVALDRDGRPVRPAPLGHHARDCAACLNGCPLIGLCAGSQLVLTVSWRTFRSAPGIPGQADAVGPAAHAPMPARGPPTLS